MDTKIVLMLWVMVATLLSWEHRVAGQTVAPPLPSALEPPIMNALNHETRKALVYVLLEQINKTNHAMEVILPSVSSCQRNVTKMTDNCLRCVRDRCMDRLYYCSSRTMSWFPMDLSFGMMSSGNDITVCSVIRGSRTCRLIMSPEGVVSRSVSVMGDKLVVRFQGASRDLGNTVVLNLATGIQKLMNDTGVNPALRWQTRMQMQNLINTLQVNLGRMGNQLRESFGSYGDYMRDWGRDMGRQMNDFSLNLQSQLGGLFGSLFSRRRKRRQAPERQPEPEVSCSVIDRDPSQCITYTSVCTSCSNITESIIPEACGKAVSDMIGAVDNELQKLSVLYDDILSSRNFIEKIEFDAASFDPNSLSLHDHNATVSIGYDTFTFASSTPMNLFRLSDTADLLAGEIWAHWMNRKI